MKRNYQTKYIEKFEKFSKKELIQKLIQAKVVISKWNNECRHIRMELLHLKKVLMRISDNILFSVDNERSGEERLKTRSATIHYYPGGRLRKEKIKQKVR